VRFRSIRAKLTAVTFATVAVALLCLAAPTALFDLVYRRRALAEQVAAHAEMLAQGCTAAVTFGDARVAREALEVLRGVPDLRQAAVYDHTGAVLAELRRGAAAPPPAPRPDEATVAGGEATAFRSIRLDGERIGAVFVSASTAALDRQVRTTALAVLLLALGALLVAILVARRLHRLITGPVLDLAGTVGRVAVSHDYAIRARVTSHDELGVLASDLNGMLEAIEERDREIDRQRRTLEETVAARTAELARANEQLVQQLAERQHLHEQFTHAQKMEAIGRLAGGVAHDFNNVLAVISASAGMLADALPGGEARADAEEILRATERAVALTRQLLAFSRRQVLNPTVLDTGAVIADVSKMIARLIGEQIELTIRVGPGLGRVFMDPSQLEQILVNLAVNARDAMPGGGRLAIEVADATLAGEHGASLPAGRYVRLRLADTGHGMDSATRARAFEPFFTTKPRGKGTGLGLAMVYGAVQAAGGAISIESEPGRGSVFEILLPHTDRLPELETRGPTEPPSGLGERILVVEDCEQVRATVSKMLSRAGYRVAVARDGEEALRELERAAGAVDLVLTDVVMPGMSGFALGARIREARPALPVLFMTGYSDELLEHHPVPADLVVSKPLDRAALLARMRQLLDAA
jgi:signal transduction histidine kinase